MTRKTWILTIAAIVFAGCGGSEGGASVSVDAASNMARDLSTPSKRLVGHWTTPAGDHLYYAAADAEGIGGYILVQPDSNTARHRYKIVSEQASGERLLVTLLFSSGNSRGETLYINAAGTSSTTETIILGSLIRTTQSYVDAKTSPQ